MPYNVQFMFLYLTLRNVATQIELEQMRLHVVSVLYKMATYPQESNTFNVVV